jgi:16S rRNA G966 N2-methylase RsmD
MSVPALPDPSAIDANNDPAGRICALVGPASEWLAQASDLAQIEEARAQASAYITYVKAKGLADDALRAACTLQLRSAVALGRMMPKLPTAPGRKDLLPDGNNFRPDERSRFRTLAANIDVVEQAIAESPTDKLSPRSVLARIERKRRQNKDDDARHIDRDTTAETISTDRWAMHPGDLAEVLPKLADHSIDAIVTDPPYPTESLPLWSVLAEHAARVLVPDGLLIGMTGQIQLPEVMRRLGEHLTFGWMYCQLLPASQSRIRGRNIYQGWKPWLIYTTGTWPSGRIDWNADVLDAVTAEKGTYAWQQSVRPAEQLIERLVPSNGLVLDPFTGSGSYGEAALNTGRRFIGIEADGERFGQAVERLES